MPPRIGSFRRKYLQAQQQNELYQARISKTFKKKDKERIFKKGDLILTVRRPMVMTNKTKGKFSSKGEVPFQVESDYLNIAYHLINQEGNLLMMPINGKFLKILLLIVCILRLPRSTVTS